MRRLIISLIVIAIVILVASGCGNRVRIDTNYVFEHAIIVIGEKVVEVEVKQWTLYSSGRIKITSTDGIIYNTHLMNVLIQNK